MTEEEKITALASFAKEVIETVEETSEVDYNTLVAIGHPLGIFKRVGSLYDLSGWLSRIQKEEGSGSGADASAPIPSGNNGWRPIAEAPKDGKTVIWAAFRTDIYPALLPTRDNLVRWNGVRPLYPLPFGRPTVPL